VKSVGCLLLAQPYIQPEGTENAQISHTHTLIGVVESCDGAVKVSADGWGWIEVYLECEGLRSKVRVPVPSGRQEALCVKVLVYLQGPNILTNRVKYLEIIKFSTKI